MMENPRAMRPTDLMALLTFDGRTLRNEAVTWDRLCRAHEAPHAIGSALSGALSFATGRHTLISVDGQRLHSFVSGRRRSGPSAWEVDTLLSSDEEPAIAPELLLQLSQEARNREAQRIFLRLADGSPAYDQVLSAGFVPYRREWLAVRSMPLHRPMLRPAPPAGFRLREQGDTQALFWLYCETVPEAERMQEAATLSQWLALKEPDGLRRRREYVLEELNGRISAWLRVGRDGRAIRIAVLLLHPDRAGDAQALITAALEPFSERGGFGPTFVLSAEHVAGVTPALHALGFLEAREYVMLARRLAVEVRQAARQPGLVRSIRTVVPVQRAFSARTGGRHD